MNYYLISFLVLVLPFAFFSILQDIKARKISNYINITFLYLSILVFVFFLTQYDFYSYLILIFIIGFSYYFYHKNYWGGADGKIFIALTLLILALGNKFMYLDFILNLVFFYSLVIIILIIFKTPLKIKKELLKNIDYGMILFHVLIIFLIVKIFLLKFVSPNSIYYSFIIIFIFILVFSTNKLIKNFYSKLNKFLKIFLLVLMFSLFFYFSSHKMFLYFFIILAFRVFLLFTSEMTSFLKSKHDSYQSPFSIYLFFSAIITMIASNNVINLIVQLFFK